MNIRDVILPGERADIETIGTFKRGREEKEKEYYITKIFDIPDEEDVIELVMPMEGTKLIVLEPGSRYNLFLFGKKGIYSCEAEVRDRRNEGSIAIAEFSLTTELAKVQRREFYRFNCVVGMTARELPEAEEAAYIEKKILNPLADPEEKCVILDISGGGMRFVSAAKFAKGSLVHARFVLNVREEQKRYDVVLRVLFADPAPGNPRNTEYRGQFLFLEGGAREDIVRFIFEEQRKERQRQTGS